MKKRLMLGGALVCALQSFGMHQFTNSIRVSACRLTSLGPISPLWHNSPRRGFLFDPFIDFEGARKRFQLYLGTSLGAGAVGGILLYARHCKNKQDIESVD